MGILSEVTGYRDMTDYDEEFWYDFDEFESEAPDIWVIKSMLGLIAKLL